MGLLSEKKNRNGVLDIFRDDWVSPLGSFGGLGNLFGDVYGLNKFSTNLVEEDESYVLTADMPGVSEDNIEVSFDNNVLTVSCKQSGCCGSDEEGVKTHWQERYYGESTRSFRINNVDPENISAELSKGVLSVRMAKRQTTTPVAKQIEIKTK